MRNLRDTDADWQKFGSIDRYWAVCTHDKFRRNRITNEARQEFFESGCKYVQFVFDTIRQHLLPEFAPKRAIDFGCGVGRLTVHLASCCEEVVGIDVSPGMLEEAQRNFDERGITNARLVVGDDMLSQIDGTFDFINSYIVLQHIPVFRGNTIIRRLIDLLEPDGVGVLQLTYGSASRNSQKSGSVLRRITRAVLPKWVRKGLREWAKNRKTRPIMQMNDYDLSKVFQILYEAGCLNVHVRFTDHGGYLGLILFFQKKTIGVW